MSTPAEAPSPALALSPSVRRRTRALAVVGGTVAALVVWVLAKYVFDAELQVSQPGSDTVLEIGPALVIISALVGALIGWGVLALLERSVARARTIWTWLALAGLLLSFVTPLTAQGATGGTKFALALMHAAVAAVVIPIFARTSPRS